MKEKGKKSKTKRNKEVGQAMVKVWVLNDFWLCVYVRFYPIDI